MLFTNLSLFCHLNRPTAPSGKNETFKMKIGSFFFTLTQVTKKRDDKEKYCHNYGRVFQ